MCKQKPYPVWFSRRRKSYPVQYERSLRNLVQLGLSINCVNGLDKNQPVKTWFTILSQTSRVRSDRGGQIPLDPPPDPPMRSQALRYYNGCFTERRLWCLFMLTVKLMKKKARIYTFKIPVSFSTFSLSLVDDIAVKTELQFSVVWKRTWPCKQDIKQNGYYFVSITNIQ